MTDLQQRYRGPSRATRVVALVVVVGMVATGIGLLGWSVLFHTDREVSSSLTAFDVVDEHTATATFTVVRESQFTDAACQLVAVAEDHAVVGHVTVPVTDGPPRRSLTVELRTERRATTVDLAGCTTPGQPRPR